MADDLSALISATVNIPMMPAALAQVMSKLNNENVSFQDLGQAIRADQGLTTRVLRVANSPLYGLSRSIDTPQQAIAVLGIKTIRGLVIGESSRVLYKQKSALAVALREHAVAVAIAAHVVSKTRKLGSHDQAFVAGIMHDIGKVLMLNSDAARYESTMRKAHATGQFSWQAEDEVYKFNHAQVGSALIKQWALPETLEHCVLYHHNAEAALTDDPAHSELICTTEVADAICHKLGLGTGRPPKEIDIVTTTSAQSLGLTQAEMDAICPEIEALFRKERGMFS